MPEVLSWEPRAVNNYFAPKFSTKMWVDDLSTHLMGDILNVVRKHEQEGLFDDDKWEHYNVFAWNYKCIDTLRTLIRISYQEFCKAIDIPVEDNIWIRAWIYPQKYGMTLDRHVHALHENSFLSGNLCLTDNNTTTDYDIPYVGLNRIKNSKGRLILFPSCIPHSSDQLKEPDRYTLAFDMITEQGMDYFRKYNNSEDSLQYATQL